MPSGQACCGRVVDPHGADDHAAAHACRQGVAVAALQACHAVPCLQQHSGGMAPDETATAKDQNVHAMGHSRIVRRGRFRAHAARRQAVAHKPLRESEGAP
jgi:hypothetical protein